MQLLRFHKIENDEAEENSGAALVKPLMTPWVKREKKGQLRRIGEKLIIREADLDTCWLKKNHEYFVKTRGERRETRVQHEKGGRKRGKTHKF